jgi:hypothetical protein
MADELTEDEVMRLKAFAATLASKPEGEMKKKANRKLSAASLAKINEAMEMISKCNDTLKALVADGVVETEEDEADGVEKPRGEGKAGEKPADKPEDKPEEKPGKKPGEEKALDLSTMTVEQANDILRLGGNHEGA